MKKILKHWFSLLAKGGEIRIVVPDIDSMARGFAKGEISWDNFRQVILGGQDYNSDYHFNVFSETYLNELIKTTLPKATVKTLATGRPNGMALELDIVIKKQA